MRADPADQERLLELQRADTTLTQLNHRLGHLPEADEVARARAEVNELTDRQAQHSASVSDLDRDIARVEREIEQVRARADKDRKLQSSGSVGAKQLEGLDQELASLARRQSELEDQQLELMERRESADATANTESEALSVAREHLTDAQEKLNTTRQTIEDEISAERATRETVAAALPADLLALYEKIHKTKPIAAALLRQRRCESCRIEQSGAELAELRSAAADDVMRCEDCGAILVRSEESGL